MRPGRVAASLAAGAATGLIVAGLVGIPYLSGPANVGDFLGNAFIFWGFLFGGVAGLVCSGVTFWVLNRHDRKTSRWGRWIAGLPLAALAGATIWWILAWGVSPFTLEGLWIYPLALVTTAGAIGLLRPRRRQVWDTPPSGAGREQT